MELGALYREEHARVLASVLARVRDFSIAEESVQDAFVAATTQWERDGTPPNPRAWLVRVALNKAIDRLRRRARFERAAANDANDANEEAATFEPPTRDEDVEDERLRLLFLCCHPALAPESQVALTLRTASGLSTEVIAGLFFVETKAMAQRLVRAQRQLRDARVPYALPGPSVWSERLTAVLAVVYLLFTEGYAPTEGSAPVRGELCDEAIRLSRLLVALVPKEGDAQALLALMLLHDARREARFFGGELVDLEEQDRARWDRGRIDDGLRALDRALDDGASGPYALQASIAAIHARAASAAATDWPQILALYDMLVATEPTPSVALNRAIAVAMASGPQAGLKALDALRLMLGDSHLFHAARASLLVRVGRPAAAERAYRAALARVRHPAERRFLERRLAACRAP